MLEPIGNLVPPQRLCGKRKVGVAFVERTALDQNFLDGLDRFDLVITGSNWNQRMLEKSGFSRSIMIHQGIDPCNFHPVATPRLINRPFVIFAGGKLEARKGQDLVIEAFRRLLKTIPDAILIGCWANIGNVGIDTISLCEAVQGSPKNGDPHAIFHWLLDQGIPARNLMIPSITANAQLPGLMKQADAAVFASRCEGGTNLMAMETLACGIPTILSANTGHLDLLEMELDHALPVGGSGVGKVPDLITKTYGGDAGGIWGETDPEEIFTVLLELHAQREKWSDRGKSSAKKMGGYTWQSCMQKLLQALEERELLTNN
ncbi:glycosyltransferase family 4 protein [Cyanobium sp. HWJ4-Hawea]|uniref:glycosyltransferase family 4 protein n=1 Tax=Cyanobium sp. HWJ4-Hawea TaxID=2823713 RepID=UPI0020CDE1DA|nr:glycosyltransferase family 4 protein [Cyanobium sp. HWJ4-Hawea]